MSEKQISRRIVAEMKNIGLTQSELARKASITTTVMSRICRGEKEAASPRYLVRLAKVFGVTVEYLSSGNNRGTPEEARLVELFRGMKRENRAILMKMAESLT